MSFLLLIVLFFPFLILPLAAKSMDGTSNQNAAKYAFFYMLSLVALIFTTVSVGMVAFQIINKLFPDPLNVYQGKFSSSTLRFAISALIIAAPVFYVMAWQIFKNLKTGALEKESGVRKWLTYFILLVAAVVVIGWLIATLNSFLNGDLTVKFTLKALASILIAAIVFSFYFYDIRRKDVTVKDNIIRVYFYGTLVLSVAALIASFFFIESPAMVRARTHDRQVVLNLDQVDNAINTYYNKNKTVPDKLADLLADKSREIFITSEAIKDPQSGKEFIYQKKAKDQYEICADFNLSNKNRDNSDQDMMADPYIDERWAHDAGHICFTRKAELIDNKTTSTTSDVPAPVK